VFTPASPSVYDAFQLNTQQGIHGMNITLDSTAIKAAEDYRSLMAEYLNADFNSMPAEHITDLIRRKEHAEYRFTVLFIGLYEDQVNA
jgi:hypothetical protein